MPARIAAPPEVIARVVLSSPPPAEWDYQPKQESKPTDSEDADTAPENLPLSEMGGALADVGSEHSG